MGDVGERLGTELVFPENGDVGNAIGAVCSKMHATMTATILPTEEGSFRVVVPFSDSVYRDRAEQAIEAAQSGLRYQLTKELRSDGATNIEVMFRPKYYTTSDDGIWSQNDIDHIEIVGRAIGDPPGSIR